MPKNRVLDAAADSIASAGSTSAATDAAAANFDDPLADAYSIAAAATGKALHLPDPREHHRLSPGDALAASSGLLTAPRDLEGQWWRSSPDPLILESEGQITVSVPARAGSVLVTAVTRLRRRAKRSTCRELPTTAVAVIPDVPSKTDWLSLVRWSLRRRSGSLWLILLLSAITGAAAFLLPGATAVIFGQSLPAGDLSRTTAVIAAFLIGTIGAGIVMLGRNLLIVQARDDMDRGLSESIAAHAMRLAPTFFRRRTTGDVLDRILSVEQARAQVDDSIVGLVLAGLFGTSNLIILFFIAVPAAIAVTATVVLVIGFSLWLQLRAQASLVQLLEERSQADASLMGLTQAIVPIRVSGAEDRALAHWAGLQSRALASFTKRMRFINASDPIDMVAPAIISAVLVAAMAGISGPSAAATFMAAYAAAIQLSVAVVMLTQNLVVLSGAGAVLARAGELAAERPEGQPSDVPARPLAGAVELADVDFSYDPEQALLLDRFSLRVEPGEFVAIVGSSGSGKTTVLRLLLGFENPIKGSVTYDGIDLADLDVPSVRRQIGTVLQSARPFGKTIRDCVAGPRLLDDAEIWKLLTMSGLEADVRALDGGLDAKVGAGGGTLSGGQSQRLMIARALAGEPQLLLLDEATSALDNVTQRIVVETLLERPVTRIVVAHRLSTVQRADRVIVMERGRIVEQGPPNELAAAGGSFAALAKRQEI